MSRGRPLLDFKEMAERTGLEPATPGVTGRYSNQLNYIGFFSDPKVCTSPQSTRST